MQLSARTQQRLQQILQRSQQALSPYATPNEQAVRKFGRKVEDQIFRTPFGTDIDKILHNAFYNRYTDKTQVFSFYKNDDITRRALHVQLVSRISRVIGSALGLNLELIEAIALGHDIGHTPFGHKGEHYLSKCYRRHTNRSFNHNVHSVRVLRDVTQSNLTLQTYDGILCHCGEKVFSEYSPAPAKTFESFDALVEACYTDPQTIGTLRPSTLEGCVVRVSDMIAYVGKDRQDAMKAGLLKDEDFVRHGVVGARNYEIINVMITDLIENSLDRPYLKLSDDVYGDFAELQKENNRLIYQNPTVALPYEQLIRPMMTNLYERLRDDYLRGDEQSPIFRHHLQHPIIGKSYWASKTDHTIAASPDDVVTDYIASMTDDYFIDLYRLLFPGDQLAAGLKYRSYFD